MVSSCSMHVSGGALQSDAILLHSQSRLAAGAQQARLSMVVSCAVLSERDAWVRMPAMKTACGACSASLPCPKARATSLAHRHRAARALLVSPMRIR